jgi:hypothetical protein
MDPDALTKRIDALAFPTRQRFLAGTSRSPAGTPALTTLLERLNAQPGVTRSWVLLTEALTLAVAALRRRADLLPPLRRIAELADRPVLAWQAANRLVRWLADRNRTRPDLLTAAQALTDTPAGAELAVAIMARAGGDTGWPRPCRALPTTLRAHPDPDVRDRALHTTIVPE